MTYEVYANEPFGDTPDGAKIAVVVNAHALPRTGDEIQFLDKSYGVEGIIYPMGKLRTVDGVVHLSDSAMPPRVYVSRPIGMTF